MEKYATYDYFENENTKEIKKISLHDQINVDVNELMKTSSKEEWKKITDKQKVEKLENQKK